MCRIICANLLLLVVGYAQAAQPDNPEAADPQTAAAADLVVISNAALTMTQRLGRAEPLAIAVRDETISWVGKPAAAQTQLGPATRVIKVENGLLMPGFIDAHGHISFVGMNQQLANVASPPVGPVETLADLQQTLRSYIQTNQVPAGEWVVGRGYDDSLIEERRHPDRDDLDAVSSEHPILLIHVSGHLAAANSRALARAGINAETPDPAGGHIRRRANSSEPNGVLEETAAAALRRFMTAPIKDPLQSIRIGLDEYARFGLTTAQDGGSNTQAITLLQQADAAGFVNLDIVAYPSGQLHPQIISQQFDFGSYQGRVKVGGVKLMLDGSPQGKTAYMTKPYLIPPHGQDATYRGYPNLPQPAVTDLVRTYFSAKVPVIAHANGDAAADLLINAVADSAPQHDHRTVMIHAQTVREDQLTRMKNLGMMPSFFAAHTFYWGDWHRDSVFGVERAERISPTASTVARAIPFTVHNDAPVVPPDTSRLLWATVNRLTRSDQLLGGAQRISVYDALRAMTVNAAYQHFEEDSKGSLETGKQADFIVLSDNPLQMEKTDLLKLRVLRTFSRGREVYTDPAL